MTIANKFCKYMFSGEITSDVLRVVYEARNKTLGPFSPSFNVQNILLEGLSKVTNPFNFPLNLSC